MTCDFDCRHGFDVRVAVKGSLRRFAPWTAAGRSGRRGCLRGKGDVPASAGPDQRVRIRRGEISDPQPYFDELASLPEIVTLHPGGDLIGRAAQIAVVIDHPVYDCLYLACAEVTASVVITADQKLVNRATERLPSLEVRHIGALGIAG